MMKTSIRFYNDIPVRAVWNEERNRWFFSVTDVISAIRGVGDHNKNRNYWKYLKNKLKNNGSELVSAATQLKLTAQDGKKYNTDVLDAEGIVLLAEEFPSNAGAKFIEWFTRSDDTTDGKSKRKAYALFDSTLLSEIEVGTVKGLQQIHAYLFGGLYDFAGQIRNVNMAKGGFQFANVRYLEETLRSVESMPERTFDEIMDKYVEMNVAHPFREGNGRSARIWLDLMLKRSLKLCVDWSLVNKKDYLDAMKKSVYDKRDIKALIRPALTERIDDREVFMKGIDYSYYYETEE